MPSYGQMSTRPSIEPAEPVRDSADEIVAPPVPMRAHIKLSEAGSIIMHAALNTRRHVHAPEGLKKLVKRARKYADAK